MIDSKVTNFFLFRSFFQISFLNFFFCNTDSHQKLVKRAYFDQVCEGLGPHLQSLKALISLLEEKDSPIVILCEIFFFFEFLNQ